MNNSFLWVEAERKVRSANPNKYFGYCDKIWSVMILKTATGIKVDKMQPKYSKTAAMKNSDRSGINHSVEINPLSVELCPSKSCCWLDLFHSNY